MKKWSVISHRQENNGLTIISREERDKPRLPGKIEMAANVAQAVAKHIADGAANVEQSTPERRLEICTVCEHRNDDRCAVCGCYLAEKVAWRTSECPLGKWRREIIGKKIGPTGSSRCTGGCSSGRSSPAGMRTRRPRPARPPTTGLPRARRRKNHPRSLPAIPARPGSPPTRAPRAFGW